MVLLPYIYRYILDISTELALLLICSIHCNSPDFCIVTIHNNKNNLPTGIKLNKTNLQESIIVK